MNSLGDETTEDVGGIALVPEIDSWIKNNPINQGPNYLCSQEISIRLMNWIFAIYFYSESQKANFCFRFSAILISLKILFRISAREKLFRMSAKF